MDPVTQQAIIGAAGAAKENYWIATLGGTNTEVGNEIAIDSLGNAYIVGYAQISGSNYDIIIAKYNASGAIQWQRTLGGGDNDQGYGIAVDSAGNVYVTGYGTASIKLIIAKYNTSGTIQWQRTLGDSAFGFKIAVDSAGNAYVVGNTSSIGAGQNDLLIAKYNTSGTIQWQRLLGGASFDNGYGIAVDSTGNVYVTGRTNSTGAGSEDLLIAKYNTSGTIQWQRTLGGTSSEFGYGIAVDSTGNIYVTGYTNSTGAGDTDILIAKYNTSGTIQWQRTLGGTNSDKGNGIAVDSAGSIYVTGFTDNSDVLIAKYNTSGTIQWQRTLSGTSSEWGYGIAVDSAGNIYVAGFTSSTGAGSSDILIAKLPGDGSLTGTYGSLTYASSSLTDASSSLTDASSSLTDASSSLTDASSSLTDAASTLTTSTTTL